MQSRHILAGHNHRLANAGQGVQHRLDLTQFDPVAAQFDLMVGPTQKIKASVRLPADQIAGAVNAPGGKGVGQEPVGGQILALPVAPRHASPADEQFAGRAHRHRVQGTVQNIGLGIGDGGADAIDHLGHRRWFRGGPDRGFGRAIHVVDPRPGRRCQFGHQRPGQGLATDQQMLQPGHGLPRGLVGDQHPCQRRGALQVGDLVAHQLRRDGVIVIRQPLIGPAQHLCQRLQPLQHRGDRNAIVDQTGHLVDADGFKLLDPQQGIVHRAKQTGVVKIAQEGEIENLVQLGGAERSQINIHRGRGPDGFLERRKRPGIGLDQCGGRTQVVLHRRARHVAGSLAAVGQKGMQHQRDLVIRRIVPGVAQGLMIKANLGPDLGH